MTANIEIALRSTVQQDFSRKVGIADGFHGGELSDLLGCSGGDPHQFLKAWRVSED
jgi:hypothetical protein